MAKNMQKKGKRSGGKNKNLGGLIGTALGAGAGSFVGMPSVGASIGGTAGSIISGKMQDDRKGKTVTAKTTATPNLGYKYGGKTMNKGGKKSPKQLKSAMNYSSKQLPRSFNSMDVLTKPPEMQNLNHPMSDQNLDTRDKRFADEGAQMNNEMGSQRYSHLESTSRSGQRGTHTGEYKYGGKKKRKGGSLKEYRGRKHEHGGITLGDGTEVEDGETQTDIGGNEYVFSDEVIVPETNKTFASVSKELAGQGAGQQEYDRLARLQEQETGRTQTMKQGGLKNSHGGSMSRGGETPGSSYKKGGRKYQDGGDFKPHTTYIPGVTVQGLTRQGFRAKELSGRERASSPHYTKADSIIQRDNISKNVDTASVDAGIPDPESAIGDIGKTSDFGFSDVAPYIGPAMNYLHGVFGDDEVPDVPQIQRTEVRMPDAPSPRPQLARASDAHRTAMAHPGTGAQERLAGHAQRLGHESDIWAQHQQQQTQLDAQQVQTQSRLDSQRKGQQAQLDMRQRQDEMVADAQFGPFGQQAREAIGQALGIYGQQEQMEQLKEMDETRLATVLAGLSDEVRQEILQAIGRE